MRALPTDLRRQLESAVLAGRRAAETGVRAAFSALGVQEREKPAHLSDPQARLRRGLRAKQRQLGGDYDVLVWDAAYEQWHRLLFARFLAENALLRHPEFGAPVTLSECEDLAGELGEPDGWSVAARFAAEILPGIFRLDDPCVQLRLAPEHRIALERIVAGLPALVFAADDSLGWVYQYWQSERKDQVNASEVKIGGADLGPVTQLFTENYMVRFLLENSLGAWWAARHPDSPLGRQFDYLRFDDDGQPAAGRFEGWPDRVAEVTVMDPCCGSGHFLVEAFGMLWSMRAEEEGLDPVAAQDAVLRDNLFGLELDPRCVQIAMFAVALTAWKQGGGWRELPTPNIACSGIPAKAPLHEWTALADGDERLKRAIERLHTLFKDADTLGSLIDPQDATEIANGRRVQRSFDDIAFSEVAGLLVKAASRESDDPTTAVLGANAEGIARAATLLSRKCTLVATNVPYLGRRHQAQTLMDIGDSQFPSAKADLATMFLIRCLRFLTPAGALAVVTPHNWLSLQSYRAFREEWLTTVTWSYIARLGAGAFSEISGHVVNVVLFGASRVRPDEESQTIGLDVSAAPSPPMKAQALRKGGLLSTTQLQQLGNPDAIPLFGADFSGAKLSDYAAVYKGLTTGDDPRFRRAFWELADDAKHVLFQSAPRHGDVYTGRSDVLLLRELMRDPPGGFRMQPSEPLGKVGVAVAQSGTFPAAIYSGSYFDQSVAALVPKSPSDYMAVLAFCGSREYEELVRRLDRKIIVTAGTLVKVPFDAPRWRTIAAAQFPEGTPEPSSQYPTEWLFSGRPSAATEPLQAGVGRLVGFVWPKQDDDDGLGSYSDSDGIVCLPPVAGEQPAANRLQVLLARSYGERWSSGLLRQLLEQTGSKRKDLAEWLRDDFFGQHCGVFTHRPFVWHIWDGRKDGFSALVNYQRLDRAGLEKLTYTYLGDWIERQRADAADEVAGADLRLAAAQELKSKLEAILLGEPPYDIYVRWKPLHEQPIGWEPDLDDGVRLNIRPFVTAGVLRSRVNVNWNKDRGRNADGSERLNDLHFTIAEKQQARQKAHKA
jgi:hypothetical protein